MLDEFIEKEIIELLEPEESEEVERITGLVILLGNASPLKSVLCSLSKMGG